LTLDFETNKRICDEIAIIASKRLRNKVWAHVLESLGFIFNNYNY
jgi:ribosomal protein S17E